MFFVGTLCCLFRVVVHYTFSKIIEVEADVKIEVIGIMAGLWYQLSAIVYATC